MTVASTNSPVAALLVELRRDGGEPLHRQIETAVRDGIRAGRLRQGSAMPPTRAIAADLGVSRGVVVEAYQQLVAEGYLTSRTGGYTQVAMGAEAAAAPAPPVRRKPRIDFGYGRADVTHFPRAAWLRSIRTVLTDAPSERFGYLSGHGMPELREALAEYLNRVRGTSARPENVVICNGYAQGSALLIQVLAAAGARRLAVEDPSSGDDARPVAEGLGLEVVGVPVDADGIQAAALERSGADAVILTPSHQWPTGGVLTARSRVAVLRWARRSGALVIEDDYDAEYRYDRTPIGAIQGLAPDLVAYAGSASKTLAPGLRIGWLVVPAHLSAAVAAAKVAADRGSPAIDQLAFADFVRRGEFDRHLRRMRPLYRRRRDALLFALDRKLPDFEATGRAAGQHLVAWLPPDLSEAAVTAAAARYDVGVYGVSPYRLSSAGRGGLIFGYASLSERTIVEGVDLLATAVAELRG
ncbi:MAG: aminotransferase class I/II-fold pyridoxal phosphate-dependent enzyme [Actinophytocola sp.]|uniref:MocR-like pyridoxine biosynthesis transcription factor PdxR n=1 Tax=Actinophytocola sp. TaxID=1872138 RepID=UPI0013219689|nr:PLP-dependent aminotransferase family protein [Actinophytocola sp.]MPZ81218.1 aminotransferase class I/II-fold pyridoxal phosphate-dependent enzyme [Actinophytocola sp.]